MYTHPGINEIKYGDRVHFHPIIGLNPDRAVRKVVGIHHDRNTVHLNGIDSEVDIRAISMAPTMRFRDIGG